jgi:hypothetical protein
LPHAKDLGLSLNLGAEPGLASPSSRSPLDVGTTCTAKVRLASSRDRAKPCQKMSGADPTVPDRPVGTVTRTAPPSAGSQYHYFCAGVAGRKSENCCTNCGNPAPSISEVFRKLLINKNLDLFQNGPRLANHKAPAQVHLYWCPKSFGLLMTTGEDNEWLLLKH